MQNIVTAGTKLPASKVNQIFEKASIHNVENFEALQENIQTVVIDNSLQAVAFKYETDYARGVFSIPVRKINREFDVYLKGILNFPELDIDETYNYGFESGSTITTVFTGVGNNSGIFTDLANITVTIDNTSGVNNSKCLKCTMGNINSWGSVQYHPADQVNANVFFATSANKKYKVGYKYKCNNIAGARPWGLIAFFYNSSKALITPLTVFTGIKGTQYEFCEKYVEYTIPNDPNIAYVSFAFFHDYDSSSGNQNVGSYILIDNFVFAELEKQVLINLKYEHKKDLSNTSLFPKDTAGNELNGKFFGSSGFMTYGVDFNGWFSRGSSGAVDAFQGSTSSEIGSNVCRIRLLGNGAFLEVRSNSNGGYYDISPKGSFKLKPNTKYRLSGTTRLSSITGDSNNGSAIQCLIDYNNGSVQTQFATTQRKTDGTYNDYVEFTTGNWENIQCNLGFVVYGHTGAGTLQGNFYFSNIKFEEYDSEREVEEFITVKNTTEIQEIILTNKILKDIISSDNGIITVQMKRLNASLATNMQKNMQLIKLIALQ